MNNTSILILAAGKGKRMNSGDLPKVLVELANKPLIRHIIDKLDYINPEKIILIVGHQKEKVIDYVNSLDKSNIDFAVQNEQLGTGHAVMTAEKKLNDFDGDVLILAGDVPLLTAETINNFIHEHNINNSRLSVLSTIAPDATGYGRIVRDSNGSFIKITEEKDADVEIKKINEINSGIFLVDNKLLFNTLNRVGNNNSQNEYYLTDIIEIARQDNIPVFAFNLAKFEELQGINSQDDLMRAEIVYHNIF